MALPIDFHTHAFPDGLAPRAMESLGALVMEKAALDGTVSALLRSMDGAGIGASVLSSIATKPAQFESILAWSVLIASERIIPFPSVHPACPGLRDCAERVARSGFKGVKMHPFYQDFVVDAPELDPLWEALRDAGLILLLHSGYDTAFEFSDRADPARIAAVQARFPGLRIVAAHMGGWLQWDRVERFLVGSPVWMDISYSLQFLPMPQARKMILAHGPSRILFGSDSPWDGQAESVSRLRALGLGAEVEEAVLSANARGLLGI